MARRPSARYWDAGVFIAWLADEQRDDRSAKAEPVIRAAEAGHLKIVTSAISLVEVVKLDRKRAGVSINSDDAAKIGAFMRQPYLVVRNVDPRIAELARELIWEHSLEPRDAMHIATAQSYNLDQVDTFDGKLLRLNGKLDSLTISEPNLPHQLELELSEVSDDIEDPVSE